MRQRVIYVYTHDSIGLGEDGPTHQPIEHAAMLRMTPGLNVWRPCDAVETAVAWQQSLEHAGPSCLLLTRQNVPHQKRTPATLSHIARGGYILYETNATENNKQLDGIILATGSEVQLAVAVAQRLEQESDCRIRVVSMPCCDIFKAQDAAYREAVLPKSVTARLAIEAGVSDYWYQFVGLQGQVLGIDRFGLSAPAEDIFRELDLTAEHATQMMRNLLCTTTAPKNLNSCS